MRLERSSCIDPTAVQTRGETGWIFHGNEELTIPEGSAIKNGDQLSADRFQRGDMIGAEPAASFCHRETWEALWAHAGKLQNAFQSKDGYFVKYSEWRTGFWDPTCQAEYDGSLAKYMGGVQVKTNNMLRAIGQNCNAPMYSWQDSFDPYHNSATKPVYQLNGVSYGNFNYMDPKTIVINWNVHHRLSSMKFFAGMDEKHSLKTPLRQILNVHQGNTSPTNGWLAKLDSAEAQGLPDGSVVGISYCTWNYFYGNIESFADAAKKTGRWLKGSIPGDPVSTECNLPTGPDNLAPELNPAVDGSPIHPANLNVIPCRYSGTMKIEYAIPVNCHVRIQLVDAWGRVVRNLVDEHREAGRHEVKAKKGPLPVGVFFLNMHLRGQKHGMVRKIVLM